MKKITHIFPALLAVVLATLACSTARAPGVTDNNPFEGAPGIDSPDTSGPCNNVLFPFAAGRQWVYQKLGAVGGPTPDPLRSKFAISAAEVTGEQAILNMLDMGTGATTQTTVDCRDGAIINFPLLVIGSFFGDYLEGDIEVTYVSGIFAPSEQELEAAGWNMRWEGEYSAAGEITAVAEGEQTTIILDDSPIRLEWQNVGQETITIPAGTYENAYKVRRTTQVQASINFEGLSGTGTLIFVTEHWFAPYVGLLKTDLVSGSLTIMGFTFPLDVFGTVVLTETH